MRIRLQLVQLDQGHTLAELHPSIESEEPAPIPTWLHALGGVGETSPGQTRSVVVDLKAGSYALLCFLTDRAGSPPHVIKAKMLQEVTVS